MTNEQIAIWLLLIVPILGSLMIAFLEYGLPVIAGKLVEVMNNYINKEETS